MFLHVVALLIVGAMTSLPADDAAGPAAPFESAAGAGQPGDHSGLASAEAAAIVDDARERLFKHQSVRANVREFVALGNRRFQVEGRYLAGPYSPLPHLRIEYTMRVGDTTGTLVEVCDGQILRTMRTIERQGQPTGDEDEDAPPVTEVTRRDVEKIIEAVRENGASPQTVLQAELGIGGLPALLTSIERAMVFHSVAQESLGDRPCHVVTASWKPEFLAGLQQQFQVFGRNLDDYLPDHARIHFDRETMFPVRVSYLTKDGGKEAPSVALLTLEFTDIRLNEPVEMSAFELETPKDLEEQDVTEQYIQAIRGAAAEAAAAP
ncbi:MAG: hypothetical protein R3B90_00835 [Planctomycetaceae bacterium]